MDKFKTVINIANKQTSLGFGLVALVTAGGEQIFSTVVFKCPCNQLNFIYGLVFLLVPALALLTLGLIMSKKTWKLVTGLCLHRKKVCGSCGQAKSLAMVLFQISTMAFMAPMTWIAVALLNGVFTECAMTGTNTTLLNNHLCKGREKEADCVKKLHTFPCGKDGTVPKDVREEVLLTLRAESQVLGWLLIASIILSHLVVTCVGRCWSPVSYLQLKFWRLYAQEESSALDSQSAEHARALAKRNIESFFSKTQPEDIQTPSKLDWEKVSSLYKYRFKNKKQHYSNLHHFVEMEMDTQDGLMRNFSVKSTGSNHPIPAALGFVDDGPETI
uniref:Calcium homeostasis modulator family member 6 n=1 Tax=Neogobius melanostomus TaxID=47308 RepID=A0A8C6SQC6_9GOBI